MIQAVLKRLGNGSVLVFRVAGKLIRHPLWVIRRIDFYHIARFFECLRTDSASTLGTRIENYLGKEESVGEKPPLSELIDSPDVSDYPVFSFPSCEEPLVSVIIPCCNHFSYTYACLRSLADHTDNVPCEVIVADDASADLTGEICRTIGGIRVNRNPETLGFLRNCNRAAESARGKYILFLNNDTQVCEGWLKALTELMESDETVGMTGSKLIYPDGRLQEAGGIVWQDGSCWNYGHSQNPAEAEYNYVREVDYISGASIMVRSALWRKLGGFDERFSPAYYEDVDLAFSVRALGYRVVFQPASQVVHFEGVSHGTDLTVGQKAYQSVNQEKFAEKWRAVLDAEQHKSAEDVPLACDRSRNRKHLLVVDHYVPTFDRDAGSRSIFRYLELFVQKGFRVTLIGDNFTALQPYTSFYQQMGIEVLYGSWYYLNWKKWLKENARYFDYVILNRPQIAVKYIDLIRKYSQARIIYNGLDLMFLREERAWEVTGSRRARRHGRKMKKIELSLMRKADVSYYPSFVEEEMVHRIDPTIRVRTVPLYRYDNVPDVVYDPKERAGLMFVGGYNHQPNVDAMLWFVERIFPAVRQQIPDITLYIMGSNSPAEVEDLEGTGVRFLGQVSDEELDRYYRETRISIAPLRYGAGVKGKVLEAMSKGLPVITTSIGAEGITDDDQVLCIADDEEAFARRLTELYCNEEELRRRSRESVEYIREHFSTARTLRVISEDFDLE